MAEILVRGLEPAVVQRLKKRAKAHGRSLQAEAKGILEQAATLDMDSARALIERIRRKLGRKRMPDSTLDIRRDRRR